MASDLYRDALKDRDQLTKSNPRARSAGGAGGLTSSDFEYRNYLAAVRPRVKSVGSDSDKNPTRTRPRPASFVDSAVRTQSLSLGTKSINDSSIQQMQNKDSFIKSNFRSDSHSNDVETIKANKALYSEFSYVPSKKTEQNYITKNERNRAGSLKSQSAIDFTNLKQAQSDTSGSVGKLRSMFDKSAQENARSVAQIRSHGKRSPRPLSASFVTDTERKTSVSGNYEKKEDIDREPEHLLNTTKVEPLNIDNLLCNKNNETIHTEVDDNFNKDGKEPTKNHDVVPLISQYIKKPDGKTTECDHYEDRIVPTNKIDVNSMLASEDKLNKEKDSSENNLEEEQVTAKHLDNDLSKSLELGRLQRTEQEVAIEKKFNLRRRSLKERLSDCLASEDKQPLTMSSYVDVENDVFKQEVEAVDEESFEELHITDQKSEPLDTVVTDDNYYKVVPVLKSEPLNISPTSDKINPDQNENRVNTIDNSHTHHEIDSKGYKSAVERFDEFISIQEIEPAPQSPENLHIDMTPISNVQSVKLTREELTDRKPLKKTFSDAEDNPNVVHESDHNRNFLKLEGAEKLLSSSDTDTLVSEDDNNLMDSILNHMEKSKKLEDDQCISLLRSSSITDEPNSTSADKSGHSDIQTPETILELNKKQAPISPPISEDELVANYANSTESVPDQEFSCSSSRTTECESESACSSDDLYLPPLRMLPLKSNLCKTKHESRRKVRCFDNYFECTHNIFYIF